MRGCVSAGMIAAVSTFGLMDSFDAVYGSSAGSLVGAYAIAGQVRRAVMFATISAVCLCCAWGSAAAPDIPCGARKTLSLCREVFVLYISRYAYTSYQVFWHVRSKYDVKISD